MSRSVLCGLLDCLMHMHKRERERGRERGRGGVSEGGREGGRCNEMDYRICTSPNIDVSYGCVDYMMRMCRRDTIRDPSFFK